jgi:heat shock protein HslJ
MSNRYYVVAALLLVALAFAIGCGGPTAGVPEEEGEKEATTVSLTEEALKNTEYPSEWEDSGTITLTDGRYEGEPFVEGGASRLVVTLVEPVAFGDLDGDGIDDAAVILAANAGGSGTFLSLEAMGNEGGEPAHRATYPLGDRAQIESLAIESGQIVLEMVTHGPDDPMCCPTQRAEQTYVLQGDELVQTSSQVISSGETDDSDIVGIVWTWERFDDTADQNNIVVDNPDKYTLELRPDGTYQVKADCNLSSGGYILEGNSLTLQPGPTTLAECEPGSLYDEYLARLGEVVTFVLDEGKLVLNLKADAGNMVFTKGEGKITGITWQWAGLVETEPAAQSVVPDPENYTLTLRPDGICEVKADCNMVSGSYVLEGDALTIKLGPSTMAYCGDDSLDQQYLELLANVDGYTVEDGRLVMELKAGAGRMTFTQ